MIVRFDEERVVRQNFHQQITGRVYDDADALAVEHFHNFLIGIICHG